ncbi:MAG TPA: RHS repeat-associated core domain-containing protein [Chthonomonadaceae bacterium]|nr:RHS repeat-associated core domain-containing protein [Chthonomonadaceae bacterium]
MRTTDNMGDTTRYRYDSRGNMISTSDAQYSNDPRDLIEDPLGVFPGKDPDARRVTRINRPGNTNEFFYDGLDRRVAEIRQLRVSGQGKNQIDLTNPVNPDGVILTSYLWDVNNRLVAMADDGCTLDNQNTDNTGVATVNPKGNVTRYEYDALNRQTREVSSDGSSSTVTYDADDDPVRSEDANGSTVNTSFDVIKRVLKKEVNRGKQVVGTTLQEFSYDGLSRLTRSFDNNDPDDPAEAATVIFAYDSLSRLLEEVQNGHVVSGIWDGANDRIGLIYPNGRQIEMSFDKLDRINAIKDQGATKDIAGYSYIGPERVLERNYANGVRMTYLDDSRREDIGYDGIGRPIVLRHLRSDNSPVLGFAQTFDRMKNKLSEKKLHNPANSELYAYDSASRLVDFQRGALDAGNEAIAKPSADSLQRERWTLDGVGNWQQMLLVNGGNSISESRQHSSLNEMTQRKRGSALSTILFDRNGNVTDDGTYLFTWDFKNRLRTASRKSDRAVIGVYSYDAFGRRIRKVVTNAGALNSITNFYLDGGQEIEERDKADAPSQQYVYGHYLDEPLVLDRNLRGHTSAFGNGDQRLFYHQNTLLSVFALTDSSGRVVEGYQYDAYGRQTVLRSAVVNGLLEFARDHLATVGGFSGKGNPFMFTGRRLDAEIGMYYYRTRYLDPLMGRFTSRDAFGTWADIGNFGNAYSYVGNRPTVKVDPRGAFGDDVAPPASGSTTTGPPTTPGCKLVPNIWWANTCTVGGCTGGGKCEGTEWQLKFFRKVLVSEGNYTPNHADDYEPTACGCKNNTPELCPAPTPAPPPPDRFDLGPALELMTEWGLYPGVLLEGYSEHYHGKGMVGGGEEEYDIPFPQPGPYGGYNGWGPRWGPPARNQWQETFGD